MTEHDEANLPKWVQGELRILRMRLEEQASTIKSLTEGDPDSDTFVYRFEPGSNGDWPLGRGTSIRFDLDKSAKRFTGNITAKVTERPGRVRALEINGDETISIEPVASNMIRITLVN